MNDIDITLYLNEYRVKALADALAQRTANTVEDELHKAFDALYLEYVPGERRADIEARYDGKHRFAVYHIRENGENYHFTSEHFVSPMQAAYRYRLYAREQLSAKPQTFAHAFIETDPIPVEKFAEICEDMNSDSRVTALIEFDLDNDAVSVCESSDNAWQTYSCHDFSVAAFKAYRSDYRDDDCRREIFEGSLAGKEIDMDKNENHSMAIQ